MNTRNVAGGLAALAVALAVALGVSQHPAAVAPPHPTPPVSLPPQAHHGLGALPEASFPGSGTVDQLNKIKGKKPPPPEGLPLSFTVDIRPPQYDQADYPWCVVVSTAWIQAAHDYVGSGVFYSFDWRTEFSLIGGTAAGANLSTQLSRQKSIGYPLASGDHSAAHRIASYWKVDRTVTAIKQALVTYGALEFVTPVYQGYLGGGIVSKSGTLVGYHASVIDGYSDTVGALRWENTWGADWSIQGHAWIPYSLVTVASSYWVLIDDVPAPIVTPAPTAKPTAVPTPKPATPRPATPAPVVTAPPSKSNGPSVSPQFSLNPTPAPSAAPTLIASLIPTANPGPSVVPSLGPIPSPNPAPPASLGFPLVILAILLGLVTFGPWLWSQRSRWL